MKTFLITLSALNLVMVYVNYSYVSTVQTIAGLLAAGLCLGVALEPQKEKDLPWDGPDGGVA